METEFVSHWCPSCGGSSHPATGSVFSANYIVCYRCTLEFAAWVQRYTNAKGRRRGPSFYAHVQGPAPREA